MRSSHWARFLRSRAKGQLVRDSRRTQRLCHPDTPLQKNPPGFTGSLGEPSGRPTRRSQAGSQVHRLARGRRSRARVKVGGRPVPAPGGTEHATSPPARPGEPTSPRGRRQLRAGEVLLVVLVFVLRRRLCGQILRLRRLPGAAALGPGLPPATRHLPLQFLLRLRRRRQGSVHGRTGGFRGPSPSLRGTRRRLRGPPPLLSAPSRAGGPGEPERAPQEEGTGREGGKEGREGRRAGASREPGLAGRSGASGSGERGRRRAPGRPDPAHSETPPRPLRSHASPRDPVRPPRGRAPRPRRPPRPLPVAVSQGVRAGLGLTSPELLRPFGGCHRKEPDLFVCLLAPSFSFSQLHAQPATEVKCQGQVS